MLEKKPLDRDHDRGGQNLKWPQRKSQLESVLRQMLPLVAYMARIGFPKDHHTHKDPDRIFQLIREVKKQQKQ